MIRRGETKRPRFGRVRHSLGLQGIRVPENLPEENDASEPIYSPEARFPETGSRGLLRAVFEDGLYCCMLFEKYLHADEWKPCNHRVIQELVLAVDWMFSPDEQPWRYHFEPAALALGYEPEYLRRRFLQFLGVSRAELHHFLLRARWWLLLARQVRGPDRKLGLGVPVIPG